MEGGRNQKRRGEIRDEKTSGIFPIFRCHVKSEIKRASTPLITHDTGVGFSVYIKNEKGIDLRVWSDEYPKKDESPLAIYTIIVIIKMNKSKWIKFLWNVQQLGGGGGGGDLSSIVGGVKTCPSVLFWRGASILRWEEEEICCDIWNRAWRYELAHSAFSFLPARMIFPFSNPHLFLLL